LQGAADANCGGVAAVHYAGEGTPRPACHRQRSEEEGLRTREGSGARHWLRAWSKPLASRVRAPSREIFASRGREQNIYRV